MTSQMVVKHWPAWVAGEAVSEGSSVEVTHPGDDSVVGTHVVPTVDQVEAGYE